MKRFVMLLIISCGWSIAVLAADSPLDARVTVDYRNAPAADVIGALARGAGINVQIGPGQMRPVTITLTNVRLSNALNAICDNALCVWVYGSSGLQVDSLPNEQSASLPPRLSFEVHDATAADVFRALAAVLNVPVTIDPSLTSPQPLHLGFRNVKTVDVLTALCVPELLQCEWDFDPARGLRVTRKR